MSYYAKFESHGGEVFRLDTRIYLQGLPLNSQDGKCIAAIVGKNPGSARSSGASAWTELELNGDKLLPTVRNIFLAAYGKAGKPVPSCAFVQVWNLFYLCNKDLRPAVQSFSRIVTPPVCSSEQRTPDIIWYVWGNSDRRLDSLKERFQNAKCANVFFYNQLTGNITARIPTAMSFARHTQGLTVRPVVDHLAGIL